MTILAMLASAVIGGYAAYYLILCVLFPFGRCRRCDGGTLNGRRTGRLCPRCEGTGRRVRVGRRIFEYLRAEYERGTR